MIGSLRGRLAHKQPPQIILECGGVGYEIETPMSTFLALPGIGSELFLYTHLVVREDAQTLFGFSTEEEKSLFRSLLKVSGVGAKMGLAILSGMSVTDFQRCVQYEDAAMLVKIPGVGKKTAERLIIEMRDRIDSTSAESGSDKSRTTRSDPRNEAFDALISLGYRTNEINRLLGRLDIAEKSAEDIIRLALRQAVN
jgi:holliday junction DNA helicase RuvA